MKIGKRVISPSFRRPSDSEEYNNAVSGRISTRLSVNPISNPYETQVVRRHSWIVQENRYEPWHRILGSEESREAFLAGSSVRHKWAPATGPNAEAQWHRLGVDFRRSWKCENSLPFERDFLSSPGGHDALCGIAKFSWKGCHGKINHKIRIGRWLEAIGAARALNVDAIRKRQVAGQESRKRRIRRVATHNQFVLLKIDVVEHIRNIQFRRVKLSEDIACGQGQRCNPWIVSFQKRPQVRSWPSSGLLVIW